MITFTINGKKYDAREMDFNFICKLEDEGMALEEFDTKTVKFLRAYFSFCSGLKPEDAGTELTAHVIAGGDLDELSSAMFESGEQSGFLQALTRSPEEKKKQSQGGRKVKAEVKE